MKITVVNFSRRVIGGTEQNLSVILPEFERLGHQIQFVYLHDEPADRREVTTGPNADLVHVSELGEERSLERIRFFRPDLINVHGEIDPGFQSDLLRIAPAAYSVHNYYGTCISGLKTHQLPVIQPCNRQFGPRCLLAYYPRRCGGLNPVTMLRRYWTERDRLEVMSRYAAVIVHSGRMEAEYVKHGIHPSHIYGLPYEVAQKQGDEPAREHSGLMDQVRLLFVGRMEKLKGGHLLIESLPILERLLERPIELHLAGEGPRRAKWQDVASRVVAENPSIAVQFHGWCDSAAMEQLFQHTDLLAVPSLWPEPFGKVGPEAGTHGIPVAAFDVGGIGEWLTPGVNGFMAPGDPPTADGLAHAMAKCLTSAEVYKQLSRGAVSSAKRFGLDAHVNSLIALFEQVSQRAVVAA